MTFQHYTDSACTTLSTNSTYGKWEYIGGEACHELTMNPGTYYKLKIIGWSDAATASATATKATDQAGSATLAGAAMAATSLLTMF